VPARLQNLLNLESMTMLMDLLLGPGLVLHAIRSRPFGNERVQIVLRARRDPHDQGYAFLEPVGSVNTSATPSRPIARLSLGPEPGRRRGRRRAGGLSRHRVRLYRRGDWRPGRHVGVLRSAILGPSNTPA